VSARHIDIDVPANDYLRAYRLVPANAAHRPATVRHLLTHGRPPSAGALLSRVPADPGETVKYEQRVPTLAEFYRGALCLRPSLDVIDRARLRSGGSGT
jgi:CubicO group peptidase (beta-lactamase class C family)